MKFKKGNMTRYKHGHNCTGKRSKIYNTWDGMIQRCSNPKTVRYEHYGGRGICVCEAWQDAATFIKWALGSGYKPGLQIDRKDNDGPYCPENCHWVTNQQNNWNRSNNVVITAFGVAKCLAEWILDPRCTVSRPTVLRRIQKCGLSPEEAITLPAQTRCAFLLGRVKHGGL